jgi:hypothetical protein
MGNQEWTIKNGQSRMHNLLYTSLTPSLFYWSTWTKPGGVIDRECDVQEKKNPRYILNEVETRHHLISIRVVFHFDYFNNGRRIATIFFS